MQLIPAIDLRHGEVVRLIQGDDERRTGYGLDPEDLLAAYGEAGVELVHVVDLDGAFGEERQWPLIRRLAARGCPRIELGGGLGDRDGVSEALAAGCERVILGSLVGRDFDAFAALAHEFSGRVLPALEVADGTLRVAGWREEASLGLDEVCRRLRGLPCPAMLVTDVEKDGTLSGPNLELTLDLARRSALPALLSGGIHALEDLRRARRHAEIAGVIVGKALYEGAFDLSSALAACTEEAA